jgi:hypothetical protein
VLVAAINAAVNAKPASRFAPKLLINAPSCPYVFERRMQSALLIEPFRQFHA